ncbi:helix-turn-helix domain-containing protein [Butyrivibrio sp. AE3004]|uniref:helix-turn-helix domain-containing protein n=1 Tax=Butyrivibrio sp. AE3004 TaxID=1506994 RepID=UPI00068DE43B|nr:AraC family transcriptional regulator [Butyrivibrio sp. AE3004]
MSKKEVILSEHENASHGDIFLPVNSYHSIIPKSYGEVALHWHEEMEITLVKSGVCAYRVGQETFLAKPGDIILVPPFCTHSASEVPGKILISDSLVFSLDLLGAGGQDLSASKYLRPLAEGQLVMPAFIDKKSEGYKSIRTEFMKALKCFNERPFLYELRLREHLLYTIILLFENRHIKTPEESESVLSGRIQLRSVLQYISEHCQDKLTISELAAISGFSESYFMRIFNENVGMSAIKYINHCRIQNAAHELEETNRPVMDIAMDNGFPNISYFNLQFKREFGMTPQKFRQNFRGAK